MREVAKSVTVGVKGQVVIPARMRREVGIEPGQKLHVEVTDGKVVLTPLPQDLIGFLTGSLPGGSMLEDLMQEHAQEVRRDEESGL